MAEYIEREAAFNAILNLVPKVDDDGYCWVIRGDAARAIDSIPAADVRPVERGKWIPKHHDDGDGIEYALFHCSVCDDMMARPRNFCPNCGADMREES